MVRLALLRQALTKKAFITSNGDKPMSRFFVARARVTLAACATALLASTGAVTLAAAPAAAAESAVSDATLSWGVRESFRNYIESPVAHGQITTAGVTDSGGVYGFSGGTGTADPEAGTADVAFGGSVHFQGHETSEPGVYVLDLLLEDVEIEVAGPDQVYLVADITSRPFESTTEPSEMVSRQDVPVAAVDASAVTITEELISAEGAATTLTAEGAEAFGGFYPAGDPMDPVSFSLPVAAPEEDEGAGEEEQPGEGEQPGEAEQPGEEEQPGEGEQPGEDDGGAGEEEQPGEAEQPGEDEQPAEDESGAPEQPQEASTALAAQSTNLTWGLKESFRSYIQGPIAHGEITAEGGVTFDGETFTFPAGSGSGDSADGTALIAYPGSITFSGHGGLLQITVSDLRLQIDSATTGTIVATVVSKSLDSGEFETFTGIDLAEVTLNGADVAEGDLRIRNAPATLTGPGASGFAGFYEAGTPLDPVSAEITFTATDQDTTPPPPSEPAPRPNAPQQNAAPSTGLGSGPAEEQAGEATADEAPVCTANAVSGASLTWGLKSSFRSYISGGIANGGWTTTGGVSDADGGWTWSGGSGSINPETLGGSVSFPGSLHFTGHGGVLDTQLSNLSLRMTGPTSAALYADLVSNDMDGNASTHSGIQFATVSFPAASAGSSIALTDTTVTLTAAGAEGFAGFYEAGTTMDSLSAELPIGGAVECSAGAGTTLAATGANPVAPLLAFAGLLMVAGVALTLRRTAQR